MQFARLNDAIVHFRLAGTAGPRPPVVFVNSLGTDLRLWDEVVERLGPGGLLLTYDLRGHGLSDVGTPPYDMAMLADDLAALLAHLGLAPAIVCGVSIGGVIAQQLHAAHRPLVRGLVLCDTAARIGDAAFWAERMAAIAADGMEAVADRILERWFTAEFRRPDNPAFGACRNMLVRQPVAGYLAACAALRDADLGEHAPRIDVPTLCVVGDRDGSTPPALVGDLVRRIPGARLEILADCGHLPSLEQPARLGELIAAFAAAPATETMAHAGT